ncbi:unnamed protein product [Echinostoma caproni]|uniref:U6 snRNA-associated Sm-like protein LSm8 n=1 Tax=Echinostoma caproni TaxID=27848 RepID=A0A183A7V2_9TREM|nr:unnamed protein product [Echinostoma caproni]
MIHTQITWGLLAKSCKTSLAVRQLLHSYAEASQAKSVRSIQPSRTFVASLFAASRFNWDLKRYLLQLMVRETGIDEDGSGQVADCLGELEPDRRLIAQLEIDVALFRDLLRKDVIPRGMVNVITSDGRTIVGTLKGFDNVINLVIKDSQERVFSPTEGVEHVPLGLFIIRGQNVALVGEIDEDLDRRIDFSSIRAEPLNPVVH